MCMLARLCFPVCIVYTVFACVYMCLHEFGGDTFCFNDNDRDFVQRLPALCAIFR